MAYKSVVNRPVGNQRLAFSEIWKFLAAAGWTLHDSASKTVEAPYSAVNTTSDLITVVAHGLANGNKVFYTAGQSADVIGGLVHGTFYYVVGAAADTFQLSATQGGAAIDLTSQGGGTHVFERAEIDVLPANVNITTEYIEWTAHGFSNGNNIMYLGSGTAIGGLTSGSKYFVVNAGADNFQLASTQGGAAINLTSQGTGTHTFREFQRIYKSSGENADRIPEYIQFYRGSSTTILWNAYYSWNSATHAGLGANTNVVGISTSETGGYMWFYGDKDFVFVIMKISSAYTSSGFGHIPKRFWTTLTALTSEATSGPNVVLNVGNAADFIVGQYYQIVGASNEGRDRVQVTAKTSNTLTIASLPRNYSINSQIGQCPSTFCVWSNSISPTCPYSVAGTANVATIGARASALVTDSGVDPDMRGESRYMLTPITFNESTDAAFGYFDKYYYSVPPTSLAAEDTIGVGEIDTGTSTSDPNTTTTIKDNTKAWGVDAMANKVVIIAFGVGAGQIKKIASNTASILTLAEPWTTTPDHTSQYVICNEGYRFFSSYGNTVYREGV